MPLETRNGFFSLQNLATKNDSEDLIKKLLDKLATKDCVEVLANQVLKNTNAITSFKTEMRMGFNRVVDRLDSLKSKFDIMISAIDSIA